MAYPPAEHVPTRRATLQQFHAEVLAMLKAEDAVLAAIRDRFLSETAFLDAPPVQFHRGRRDALVVMLDRIDAAGGHGQ